MKTRYRFLFLFVSLLSAVLIGITACNNNSPTSGSSSSSTATPTASNTPCMSGGFTCTPTYTPQEYTAFVTIGTGASTFTQPTGFALAGTNLWVADYSAKNFQEWTTIGSASQTISSYSSPATTFAQPDGVAVGPDGYVYVSDNTRDWVVEFSPTGSFVTTVGQPELGTNKSIAMAVTTSQIYLLEVQGHQVVMDTISGSGASKIFTASVTFGSGILGNQLYGICLDTSGNVYVTDTLNNRIVQFSSTGTYQMAVTLQSGGFPQGVYVDGSSNIYAVDNNNKNIQTFNSSGTALHTFGTGLFNSPYAIQMDATGNLWVSDTANKCIYGMQKNY